MWTSFAPGAIESMSLLASEVLKQRHQWIMRPRCAPKMNPGLGAT
jgi:hypothetical protein